MTAGEYGTPTHYLKGKDIKVQGDCLVYCYTRRIEVIGKGISTHTDGYDIVINPYEDMFKKPERFEKW